MKILPRYTIIPSIISKALKSRNYDRLKIILDISERSLVYNMASPCFKECLLNELNSYMSDPLATHFMKHLFRRLINPPSVSVEEPNSDQAWIEEARFIYDKIKNEGIIVPDDLELNSQYPYKKICNNNPVQSVTITPESMTLKKSSSSYSRFIMEAVEHSGYLKIVDPFIHFDGNKSSYNYLLRLFNNEKYIAKPLTVELHRHDRFSEPGYPRTKRIRQNDLRFFCKEKFGSISGLKNKNIKFKLFVWEKSVFMPNKKASSDTFHDRFLLSRHIGISVPYGFATDMHQEGNTTWSRLSSDDKAIWEDQFSINSNSSRRLVGQVDLN
jgi:hypothetical protein